MFAISSLPLDPRALEALVRTDACGAVTTFCGIVRERSDDGRAVRGLSYEAHEALALAEFDTIGAEARERFGDVRVAIAHRIGDLTIGEIAVIVSVAAPHRAAAFDACEYAIDELKRRAAIWKKETFVDGPGEWKANDCAPARTPSR